MRDDYGKPIKAKVEISDNKVKISTPGRRLEARVVDGEVLTAHIDVKIGDKYLEGFPRGSEFFLAAYKFLSDQLNSIKAFQGIWLGTSGIEDNFSAFEAARTDFLAEYPEYARLEARVQAQEQQLRLLRNNEGKLIYDDVVVQALARSNWDDLSVRTQAVFGNNQSLFEEYQTIRLQMNVIEDDVNERAAFETWSGKMAKILGFTTAHLSKRGTFESKLPNGNMQVTSVDCVLFANPQSESTT